MNELFSPLETKILKVLGKRKLSITEIVDLLFTELQVDPSNSVSNAIRRINRKCEFNHLPWHIQGEGGGRAGRTVWVTKRET